MISSICKFVFVSGSVSCEVLLAAMVQVCGTSRRDNRLLETTTRVRCHRSTGCTGSEEYFLNARRAKNGSEGFTERDKGLSAVLAMLKTKQPNMLEWYSCLIWSCSFDYSDQPYDSASFFPCPQTVPCSGVRPATCSLSLCLSAQYHGFHPKQGSKGASVMFF